MISLMIIGTLWIPIVGFIIYYKWKNRIKFYNVIDNDTRVFLGNTYNESMRNYPLVCIEFEKDFEQFCMYQIGKEMNWPITCENTSQWIEKSYVKHEYDVEPVTQAIQMAAGPQRNFGTSVNFQWICGTNGELYIITKTGEEIKVNLGTNVESTDKLLNKYNVKLVSCIKIDDWSVC